MLLRRSYVGKLEVDTVTGNIAQELRTGENDVWMEEKKSEE